jgi:tRNA(Ile)-lysidine synthase
MFVFDGHSFDFGASAPAVAVALSGGPDSMALCWLLSQWAEKENVQVHALTVDHGLRAESAAEAAQVGAWVKDWPRVTHAVLKIDLPGDTRIMENARAARYEILSAYCREHSISRIFTAHHQDDQAETFLFRLAKGSGLDGLAAMRRETRYSETLTILRPLLDKPKENLVAFCRAQKIPYVEDPSNSNDDYARPRLRKSSEILAAEGLTAKRLAVTASRLARARDALEHYADESYRAVLLEKTPDKIMLDHAPLSRAPAETRLRVLLQAHREIAPADDYGPRREKMEALAESIFASGPFRRQTLGGCVFSRDGNILIERE